MNKFFLGALPALAAGLLLVGCGDKDGEDVPFGGTSEADADGDGYDSLALGGEDCNDNDAGINPDAVEDCDEVDQDCDGSVDEDAPDGVLQYPDADGDGYGDGDDPTVVCPGATGTYTDDDSDCDDSSSDINPGASEVQYDGVDNDCDASTPDNDCGSSAPVASLTVEILESYDFDDGATAAVSLVLEGEDSDGDLGGGSKMELWWASTADGGVDTSTDPEADISGGELEEGCDDETAEVPAIIQVGGDRLDYDTEYEFVLIVTDKGGTASDPVSATATTSPAPDTTTGDSGTTADTGDTGG